MRLSHLTKYVLARLILLLTVGTCCAAAAEAQTVTVRWTAQNMDALKQIFSDKAGVEVFIRQMYGDVEVEPNVGDYTVIDLNGDGDVELVATLDFSGRAFYTTLMVVHQVNERFKSCEVSSGGANIGDLKSRIVDLRHNGTKQILVPRLLSPYAGASPTPVVTDVYKWSRNGCQRANAEFKDYYSNTVLPRLTAALIALSQGPNSASPATVAKLKDKYQKEIDEVQKIIGQ